MEVKQKFHVMWNHEMVVNWAGCWLHKAKLQRAGTAYSCGSGVEPG